MVQEIGYRRQEYRRYVKTEMNLSYPGPAITEKFCFLFVEIISSGYLIPLPERDANGRQLILSCAGKFDPYKHTSEEMARTHSLICEALLDDEESQVAGYSYVNDESGLSMGLLSLWSLSDIRCMIKCIQVRI